MIQHARSLPRALCSDKLCSLHSHKLIENLICQVVGMRILASMFRFSMVMRSGGFYLRLLHNVDQLRPMLRMKKGPPPAEGRTYALEAPVCNLKRVVLSRGLSPFMFQIGAVTRFTVYCKNLCHLKSVVFAISIWFLYLHILISLCTTPFQFNSPI